MFLRDLQVMERNAEETNIPCLTLKTDQIIKVINRPEIGILYTLLMLVSTASWGQSPCMSLLEKRWDQEPNLGGIAH